MKKLIVVLALLPCFGCASLEVHHSPDRRKITFEKPIQFTYDLDLVEEISRTMRANLNISTGTRHPEIILKDRDKDDILGIQYNIVTQNEAGELIEILHQIIEVYYAEIKEDSDQRGHNQETFEATIYNVGVHEALHAYYSHKYREEHAIINRVRKNLETLSVGHFDHCKMIETGDLERYTSIIDRYFDDGGVAKRTSLARARFACGAGENTQQKNDKLKNSSNKHYRCILR